MMNVLPWIIRDVAKVKKHKGDLTTVVHCNDEVLKRVILEDRKQRFPKEFDNEMINKCAIAFWLCKSGRMAYVHKNIKFRYDERVQYYELRKEFPK